MCTKGTFPLIDSFRATIYSVQMFVTHRSHQEWLPPFTGYENCQAWAAVELPTAPWFIVHLMPAGGDCIPISLQISNMNHVAEYLGSLGPEDEVRSIQAAMPAGYTGERTWTVSELAGVWRATVYQDSEKYSIWVMESTDGSVVMDPPILDIQGVTRGQQIYERRG